MITNQEETHEIDINDKASVVDLLTKSLDNPNFNSFSVHITIDWLSTELKSKKLFRATVNTKFEKPKEVKPNDSPSN